MLAREIKNLIDGQLIGCVRTVVTGENSAVGGDKEIARKSETILPGPHLLFQRVPSEIAKRIENR